MANIDELHFEVILTDEAFRRRVGEDIELANKLNTSLSDALNFNKKVKIEPLKRVKKSFDDISKSSRQAHDIQKRYNVTLGQSHNLMRTLGQLTGVTFSVVGLRRFLSTLIDVTGQFEVQKMALRNMLQDLDGADRIFDNLYRFSSESTYRFSELAKYAKQLAAFNIEKGSLLDTTKMLGDVASGVGTSMDRVILAYGHVKSSGFLRGIQLRSFSQNGIPVLEELSKMLTEIEGKAVSLGDVFDKMMKREITFDMVEEAFRRMTSEGGKFYQMQEVLAKTLAGQINILKGKWENLMYAIGESQEGILKGAVQALTNVVSSTEAFGRAITTTISALTLWKTAALIAAMMTDTLSASQVRFLALLDKAIHLTFNPYTYAIVAATAAIGGMIIAVNKYTKVSRQINDIHEAGAKEINKYADALSEEKAELTRLTERLKLAEEGTNEYASAKAELQKRFNPYIEQLRTEGKEVGDLAAIYDDLALKIEEANRQRFLESATENMGKAYGNATQTIADEFETYLQRVGNLTIAQQEMLRSYYKGTLSKDEAIAAGVPERAFNYGKPGGAYAFSQGFSPYQMGFKEAGNSIDALKDKYEQAGKVLADSKKEVMDAMGVIFGPEPSDFNGPETPNLIKIDSIVEGIQNLDRKIADLRKKAKNGGITEDEESQLKAMMESREEAAKQYKDIMGEDYDKQVKASATAQQQATNDRIKALKAEISILEKYYDAREKLEPYFGDQTNLQLAKIFGPRDYNSLDSDLQGLIDDLRLLGEEGVQAADQIEARLGMDALSGVLNQQKALEKYQNTLADWMGKDYSTSGTGVEYKASRIAAKFNEDSIKTQEKYNDAVKQAEEAHKGDADTIAVEIKKLQELRDAEWEFLKAQRDEGIAALADDVYKQATSGLNLTDWAHKSVSELKDIQEELKNIELPAWVHEVFKYNPEGFQKFIEALQKLANADIDKSNTVLDEKTYKNFRRYAEMASAFADSLTRLGEAAGSPELQAMGETLSFITDTASSVMERLAQGDTPGAIIAGITSVLTHIVDSIAAAKEFENELIAIREEARRMGLSNTLSGGVDTIFGTNDLAKVRNANKVFEEIQKNKQKLGAAPNVRYKKGFWDYVTFGLAHHNGTIADLAKQMGMDLYDSYGNLNAEMLQKILDTYKGLGREEKEWIQSAINDSEAYAEAMEQLEGVVQSVFGQIASSSADKIVESWKERRDAALDYADVLDDVATKYAKMMLESAMLDMVLDEDKARSLVNMFAKGNAEGAMEQIANDMATIQAMAPVWEQILEAFDPYFNRETGEGATLKEGINKELVEGNSSLIASYMNAMRADLSVMRVMQTSGWQDVRLVRESVPSLVDYAAQVAANTYDNAQNTAAILSKLQSIITPSTNGGSAVRTTK